MNVAVPGDLYYCVPCGFPHTPYDYHPPVEEDFVYAEAWAHGAGSDITATIVIRGHLPPDAEVMILGNIGLEIRRRLEEKKTRYPRLAHLGSFVRICLAPNQSQTFWAHDYHEVASPSVSNLLDALEQVSSEPSRWVLLRTA
jgi:hypothetical protein